MNKRLLGVFSAMVMAAALIGARNINVNAATSGLPGTNWWSSFQVQNMGTTNGTLVIQAYSQEGSAAAQYSSGGFTLITGGGLTYNPGFPPNYSATPAGNRIGFCVDPANCNDASDDALPAGFTGAVVASADVPIVAVGSVNNTKNGSVGVQDGTGHAAGNYAAFGGDKVASVLFFPLAKHNFGSPADTVIYYVQAAGVAAHATITYTMNDGLQYTQSTDIGANRTFLFDPANAGVPTTGGTHSLGSAVVVASSGVIAGVALEYQHAPNGAAAFLGSSRAFVATDYSKTVLSPIFKKNFVSNWSGWSLQNTANVTATVNVTFTVARVQAGTPAATAGVVPGQQYVYTGIQIGPLQQTTISKFRPILSNMPDGIACAGIAVSDQPLVAVVNESQRTDVTPALSNILSTYNAFNPANASLLVAAPLVKEYFPGGRLNTTTASRGGTSVSVQNAGTGNATIYVRYTAVSNNAQAAAGTMFTLTIKSPNGVGAGGNLLAPGASYVFNMVSDPSRATLYQEVGSTFPPDNVNYAVAVYSDQPVIALMQEDNKPPAGTTTDGKANDLLNYEGFNQ